MTSLTFFRTGHSNDKTVDYVSQTLPSSVKLSLHAALDHHDDNLSMSPNAVSMILSDALTRLDDSIRSDFLELFHGDSKSLEQISDMQIREILSGGNDGANRELAVRCTQGATAILALVDPSRKNVWVANLGDCQAGDQYSCRLRPYSKFSIGSPGHARTIWPLVSSHR